jgi:hypothetical protein
MFSQRPLDRIPLFPISPDKRRLFHDLQRSTMLSETLLGHKSTPVLCQLFARPARYSSRLATRIFHL